MSQSRDDTAAAVAEHSAGTSHACPLTKTDLKLTHPGCMRYMSNRWRSATANRAGLNCHTQRLRASWVIGATRPHYHGVARSSDLRLDRDQELARGGTRSRLAPGARLYQAGRRRECRLDLPRSECFQGDCTNVGPVLLFLYRYASRSLGLVKHGVGKS
jgi:hypothetical protein